MQTDIHITGLELNAPLKAFIEDKLGDLERLVGEAGPIQAHVEVGIPSNHHQSGAIYYSEINLIIGGQLLRAEAKNYDLHSAIVDAKDDLKVQIKKFKEKLQARERQPVPEE